MLQCIEVQSHFYNETGNDGVHKRDQTEAAEQGCIAGWLDILTVASYLIRVVTAIIQTIAPVGGGDATSIETVAETLLTPAISCRQQAVNNTLGIS